MGKIHKPKGKAELPKQSMRFLNVVMIIAFLTAVVQISTTVLVSWREGDSITYTYVFRSSRKYVRIGKVKYGLYKVSYDDGSHTETWGQRTENMKRAGAIAFQQGLRDESAGSASLLTSACPKTCREAIEKRIGAYERVTYASLILLCSIVLSCSIILLSIGWNILFSKNILVLMGCFILSFIIDAGAGGYWYSETDHAWIEVISAQQYPFPKCDYCFYIFMGTTVMYGICFLSLLILDLANKNKQKKSHIENINMHNRNPVNTKGMYHPLFGNENNMMMQRSASFSNMMPFNKGMNNEFPNFMQYNKMGMGMGMGPMEDYPNFRNVQPNMNPNFFPQISRQYSYSGQPRPPFQPNFQNFGNFPNRNMPSMSDLSFARQYSGMNYNMMNNPSNSQNPFKF